MSGATEAGPGAGRSWDRLRSAGRVIIVAAVRGLTELGLGLSSVPRWYVFTDAEPGILGGDDPGFPPPRALSDQEHAEWAALIERLR